MSLRTGGLAGIAVSIMILVIVVGYSTQIISEIQGDIDINETANPEGFAAAKAVFESAYSGMERMGTLIMLTVAAAVIGIVSTFAYYVRQ